MTTARRRLLATTFTVLLALSILHQTESKKLKRLLKAGLVLGALGSAIGPRFLPIPVPIPLRLNSEREFGGGHFGNDYYSKQGGGGFAPAYGTGGYNYGGGGFGSGVYGGGGGYSVSGGWW